MFKNNILLNLLRLQYCLLLANETLLRTLLSYCSLHGASGGGLASVRMELVLLLQELQQEKTQQQLLSPLPFPTTLPLLSASVACNKTVVADPVRHLQVFLTFWIFISIQELIVNLITIKAINLLHTKNMWTPVRNLIY